MHSNPVVRAVDAAGHGLKGAAKVYGHLPKAHDFGDVCDNLVAATYFGWATAASFMFDEEPEEVVPDKFDQNYFYEGEEWEEL